MALRSSELIIGDWVRVERDYEPIVQVAEIYSDAIFTKQAEYEGEEVPMYKVFPIPLTADILNKNFPDTEDGVFFWCWDDRKEEENRFEIRIEKDDVDFCVDMQYVHELQHALRLCGIKKEIEL